MHTAGACPGLGWRPLHRKGLPGTTAGPAVCLLPRLGSAVSSVTWLTPRRAPPLSHAGDRRCDHPCRRAGFGRVRAAARPAATAPEWRHLLSPASSERTSCRCLFRRHPYPGPACAGQGSRPGASQHLAQGCGGLTRQAQPCTGSDQPGCVYGCCLLSVQRKMTPGTCLWRWAHRSAHTPARSQQGWAARAVGPGQQRRCGVATLRAWPTRKRVGRGVARITQR